MDVRLFRLYDEDDNEIGIGVYNVRKMKSVVCMPGKFARYMTFFIMDLVLQYANSFVWCCPNEQSWHGHEDMTRLAKE